ncbi:protein IRX15-LIKE [Elaeis guineensis]|uniref:Protein IRX15-LIKE n=1 Tax=Elaeis guineensis var. tenera TaxID=51953 RepID=A0A6I9RKY5_ELAGV|nr:protein IRX15-LIKE [Elaeis guineensis]
MKKNTNNTKLFFLQSSPHKPTLSLLGARNRLCLASALLSFFTFASLLSLHPFSSTTTTTIPPPNLSSSTSAPAAAASRHPSLPAPIFDALLFYATSSSTPGRMADTDVRAAAAVLRSRAPCNLLVFGLGHESPLWLALNHGGHTVFVDHSDLRASRFEDQRPGLPGLEVYATAFPTRVSDLHPLLAAVRPEEASPRGRCRPVQDLLFSDCPLALSDLPNHLFRLAWDVVFVDGPPGYHPDAPGRAAAIFTAAVLARSVGGEGTTDVMVHDHDREVEKVCSEEFLCQENMVGSAGNLAHFVIHRGRDAGGGGFCKNRTSATS